MNTLASIGKKFSWSFLAAGIIMILLGLFVIAKPMDATQTIIIVVGIGFIISGILHFVAYAKINAYIPGIGYVMLQGIMDILLGVIFIFSWNVVAASIPFFLGFWMIFEGVFHIPAAFAEKKLGDGGWWLTLLYGILLIVGGYFFFAYPAIGGWATLTVMGAYLIADGVVAIIEFFSIRHISSKLKAGEPIEIEG